MQHSNSITLIVDTNLFEECKKLEEIDWSILGEFTCIRILVTRPVQNEIDNHKKGDRDRIRRKAMEAASLFRKIIKSTDDMLIVRPEKPEVTIKLVPTLRSDSDLSSQLDYTKPDDELVGSVSQYCKTHSNERVLLLSHDTGPIASAKAVGVLAQFIPDDWLLPPQTTDMDKKINRLETENRSLQQQEPNIKIVCVDDIGNSVQCLKLAQTNFEELSSAERVRLREKIRSCRPKKTVFDVKPKEQTQALPTFMNQDWIPPTDEDISDYHEKYDQWLDGCDSAIEIIHTFYQQRSYPVVKFTLNNTGTRASTDTKIRFETKGKLKFRLPFDPEKLDIDGPGKYEEFKLPSPPKTPDGSWVISAPGRSAGLNSMDRILRRLKPQRDLYSSALTLPLISRLHSPRPRPDDKFYWDPREPSDFVDAIDLDCKLWRHGQDDEIFEYEIQTSFKTNSFQGAIECSVHATNLSNPEKLLVPIEISIVKRTPIEEAEKAINQMLTNAPK